MASTIEFALLPRDEDPPETFEVVPVVDGEPLTDLIHRFEIDSGMERREVSYGGLMPAYYHFAPAGEHYRGEDRRRRPGAKTPLLDCSCGEWGCWPLNARIDVTESEVRWSEFEQPYRPERDYSGFGPFVFDREEYEAALGAIAERWATA